MVGKQWFHVLATLTAVLIICTGSSKGATSSEKCTVAVTKSPGARFFLQYHYGAFLQFTCRYQASCDVTIKFYRKEHRSNKAFDVKGTYWTNERALEYTISETRNGNEYTNTMTINSFKSSYSGYYYCVINETSNMSNSDATSFYLTGPQDCWPLRIQRSECYLPRAKNITAISQVFPNGSVAVRLTWQHSIKKNRTLKYCWGSKRWKVGVVKYPNISVTPGDHEVSGKPVEWLIVPRRDTNFNFSVLLNSHTYYMFHVGHRMDRLEEETAKLRASVFASRVYYFEYDPAPWLSCEFLQMNNASYCVNYLHPQLQIFTNHSDDLVLEDFVAKIFNKLDSIDTLPAGNCRDLAYSITCHTAYPYCDNKTTPRTICSNACDEFITGKCSGTIPQDSELFHIITNNCDHSGRSGGDPPECIPLSYYTSRRDQQEPIEDTGDCMRGNGRGYTGNQIFTKSKKQCQRWSVQEPQSHPMLPDIYRSELETAGQSCRNPGGLGSQPWCYTEDHNMRWEYCDIPKCGEKCVVSVKESPKDPAGSSLILISKLGTSKTVTCVYEASSSCSDVIVKIYHRTAIDHKAYPVDGSYWGLTRGLSYVVSPSKRNGNEYSVSMTIEAFYNGYSGWYHCVINETSNMSNSDSSVFTIFPIQPEAVPTYSECYSPCAENITAIPHIFPNGSVAVRLAWQLSIKENSNMKFCSESKRWKVGVLTYSDISVTPGDHEVSQQPAEWVIVPKRDTNFSFSAVLNTHTYYLFQVGHKNDDVPNAGVFASHVYYFGHQEQATIDAANRENLINLFVGQNKSVSCVTNGYPPPYVLWIKSSVNGGTKTSNNDSSVLELNSVTLEDAGDYYCIASNTLVNPPGKKSTTYPWKITVNVAEKTG